VDKVSLATLVEILSVHLLTVSVVWCVQACDSTVGTSWNWCIVRLWPGEEGVPTASPGGGSPHPYPDHVRWLVPSVGVQWYSPT